MKVELQKNAEAPKPRNIVSWPWKDMEVGDKVVLSECDDIRHAQRTVFVYAKLTPENKKFTTRKINGDLHVWRIE